MNQQTCNHRFYVKILIFFPKHFFLQKPEYVIVDDAEYFNESAINVKN